MKIEIKGEIGWDVTADSIENLLNNTNEDLEIEIDSPGGSVFEGIKIHNLLVNYKGKKTIIINALAASMATYIAMAGDVIKVYDNATFMIHNAWGVAIGDYKEMQNTAEVLEGLTKLLAQKYAQKTGKSIDEIRALMDKESFFFGEEIVVNGFADELIKTDKQEDKQAMFALAKERFKAAVNKLKEKEETKKIAALLKNVYKNKQNKGGANLSDKMQLELAKARLKLKIKEI